MARTFLCLSHVVFCLGIVVLSFLPLVHLPSLSYLPSVSTAKAVSTLSSSSVSGDGGSKLQQLRRLSTSSNSYVVSLSADDYRHFVLKSPRPYQLIILFTTNDKSICAECLQFTTAFEHLSQEFHRDWLEAREKRGEGTSGRPAVVFAKYDVMQDRKIIDLHRLQTIPLIISITQRSLKKQGKEVRFRNEDVYQILGGQAISGGGGTGSEVLILRKGLEWINMKTGRNVELKPSVTAKARGFFLSIGLLALFGWMASKISVLLRRYPSLILAGALVVQFVSTSGLFYSLHNGMVFSGYDSRNHQRTVVLKSSRGQYFGEGLIMSGGSLLCGLSLVGMTYVSKVKWLAEGRFGPHRQAMVTVLGGFFVATLVGLFEVYRYKSGWYSPTFFPPEESVSGPIRADRGNEF